MIRKFDSILGENNSIKLAYLEKKLIETLFINNKAS